MRLKPLTRKLTLVLSGSLLLTVIFTGPALVAAPATPPPKEILGSDRDVIETDRAVNDNLWYPSRVIRPQTWTVAGSMISGLIRETHNQSFFAAHLIFQREMNFEKSQSYGLMIANSEVWGGHWDMTHYLCMGCWAESYWGYGIGSYWKIEDELASLVDIESYHLRAKFGFENLLNLQRRLRAELIAKASPVGLSGELLIGWSW